MPRSPTSSVLYGEFTEVDGDAAADNGADAGAANGGPKPSVKIFPNEAFGFLRITVERPLRLRWEVTDEGVETLRADKRFAKLSDDTQNSIIADLGHTVGTHETDKALRDLARTALRRADIKGKPYENAIVDAFAIRDPDGDPVTDKKGNVLPDPDLRDNENVPLPAVALTYEADVDARLGSIEYRSAIDDYMTAEVLPYVPDAWVDHDKTKIGDEIPLTRHFYTYTPSRPLDAIDAEIKQLETEIQELLAEVSE
jgi:type I restriction enzyme M protein